MVTAPIIDVLCDGRVRVRANAIQADACNTSACHAGTAEGKGSENCCCYQTLFH
jgi:hypothetical protein